MTENTILIADDETSVVNLLRQIFTRKGYRVKTAVSGKEALDILSAEQVPVMLFDLNMPDMDGRDLCPAARQKVPDAVIFAVTGYGSASTLEGCREAGFDDCLVKPVNTNQLLGAVERAFRSLGQEPPPLPET